MPHAWIEVPDSGSAVAGLHSRRVESESTLRSPEGFAQRIAIRHVAAISLSIAIASLHSIALAVVLGGLAAWALSGACAAVMALSLAVVLRGLSPGLVEQTPLTQGLAWLVVLVAAARLFFATRLRSAPLLVLLLAFCCIAALTSAIASRYAAVSLLKLATFAFVVGALIGGIQSFRPDHSRRCQSWHFSLAFTILALSLLTLASPGIAYLRNGTGFQGILSHPQAFAVTIVPFAGWLAVEICFWRGRTGWRDVLLLLLFAAVIVASESRTAAAALLTSLCLTAVVVYLRKTFAPARRPVLITLVVAFLAGAILAISALVFDTLPAAVEGFLRKRVDTGYLIDSLDASRGQLARLHWENFLRHPLTGSGFGVPASNEFLDVKTVLGVPVSAAVEKGVALTATLEEVGIFGSAAILAFMVGVTRRVLRGPDFRWHALFWGCLLINFGEAVFFSLGGCGLFFWPLICLSQNPDGIALPRDAVAAPPLDEPGGPLGRCVGLGSGASPP